MKLFHFGLRMIQLSTRSFETLCVCAVVEDAGGKCLPCVMDLRDDSQVEAAVNQAVKTFGGIDILVNNASAIHLTGTTDTPMKR